MRTMEPVAPELETGPTASQELADFKAKEDPPHVASVKRILGAYRKSSQAALLYPRHSAIRTEMLDEFADQVARHLEEHGETTLVVNETTLEYRAQGLRGRSGAG